MDLLEKYEQELYDKGIVVKNQKLPTESKAACFFFDMDMKMKNLIVVDDSKVTSSLDRRFLIAHEEMHLEHPKTMYRLDEPIERIKAKERHVIRLISHKYIPKSILFNLIYVRRLELHEIAQELCLPEDIVKDAYDYYSTLETWQRDKVKYEGEVI